MLMLMLMFNDVLGLVINVAMKQSTLSATPSRFLFAASFELNRHMLSRHDNVGPYSDVSQSAVSVGYLLFCSTLLHLVLYQIILEHILPTVLHCISLIPREGQFEVFNEVTATIVCVTHLGYWQ